MCALKKSKTVKGIEGNYWKIVDCDVKRGIVCLALYLNKEHASVRENMLDGRVRFDISFPVDVSKPLEYAYAKIKESNLVQDTNEDGSPRVDENDEPVMVETNWFVDAEDC